MTFAYVGMGANVGDPKAQLEAAWQKLGRLPQTRALARSSLYRSAPVGYEDQPDFLNCVAKLETTLDANTLLAGLQEIERQLGRARTFPNAPRTIDLDLLLYDDETINGPDLQVPHPRMHERAFVLAPLEELDPAIDIAGKGTVGDLLRRCLDQPIERIPG